jgi:hypothetical protein
MSSVQNPTYLLAPNWSFRPNGRIALGNVVVDPFRPHRPVLKADPNKPLPTDETTEKNWKLSLETATNFNVSLWTKFLEKIDVAASAHRERIKNGHFTMKELVTVALKDDPSDKEISALCNDPNVKEFMKLDSVLCKPVYMITGFKIAKKFALKAENSKDDGVDVKGGGEVAPEASVGGKVEASKKKKISDEFESENDIIFAYQLLKIKPKGWTRNKKIEVTEFQPKEALLADEEEKEVIVEGEKDVLTWEDLREASKNVEIVQLEDSSVGEAFTAYEK